MCSGRGAWDWPGLALAPSVPVVAVGGPAPVFYDEVGRRLGCEVVYPPFFAVANAVGAATGVIAQSVTITVEGDGAAVCSGCWEPRAWRACRVRRAARRWPAARGGAGRGGAELGAAPTPQVQLTISKNHRRTPSTTTG